jgi:hypothetical protein
VSRDQRASTEGSDNVTFRFSRRKFL